MTKKRVVLGMSGGVDSSVAAHLLKEEGYEVIGLFMRNWDSAANQDLLGNPTLNDEQCPQEKDYEDAMKVADHLGIRLERVDFIEEYWRDVFQYFLDEYEKGRTPNPDIMCNKYIKFDAFARHAEAFDPDYIAMGHFARLEKKDGKTLLKRGVDPNKDQTYFLSQLTSEQLEKTLFPVGHLTKKEVRTIAEEAGIPVMDKKDSTGICFIGERNFDEFLRNYLPAKEGPIRTLEGDTIGKHFGLMHYTIGQRKGLGIGGHPDYDNAPWFVVGKDLETNTLYAGQGYHHPMLYATSCVLEDVNLINRDTPVEDRPLTAKFRYRQKDQGVKIIKDDNGMHVVFDEPVRAVTPGQACVFYDGEVCLGGGTIRTVYKDGDILPY
ncbi:MAG: tRNA 2-thiouridine(34) synthase MnmA [Bacillota bacterium]